MQETNGGNFSLPPPRSFKDSIRESKGGGGGQLVQECVFSTKAKSMFTSVVLGGVLEPLCLAYNISVVIDADIRN